MEIAINEAPARNNEILLAFLRRYHFQTVEYFQTIYYGMENIARATDAIDDP